MNRVVVAACGTSVLGRQPAFAESALNAADQFLDDDLNVAGRAVDFLVQAVGVAHNSPRTTARRDGISGLPDCGAEISSITGSANQDEVERVVLLASDTRQGRAAALLVAALTGRSIRAFASALTYVGHTPRSHFEEDGEEDRLVPFVDVVVIDGLDPGDGTRFRAAAAELGRALGRAAADAQGRKFELHVTGGFKATIPLLVDLVSYVAHNDPSVWCGFQDEESQGVVSVLRLPRKPADSFIREVVAATIPQDVNGSETLDGYLFDGGHRTPNALFEALKALMGVR